MSLSTIILDEYLATAEEIAQELAQAQVDISPKSSGLETELKNVVQYLSSTLESNGNLQSLITYLETCISHAEAVSGELDSGADARKNAPKYYRIIQQVCELHLSDKNYGTDAITQILGWTTRLIRHAKTGKKPSRNHTRSSSNRYQDKSSMSRATKRGAPKAWERPNH